MVKNSRLSVNSHHKGQKFTDKALENAILSVKCVLLTDKSTKIGSLSVNLSEILLRCQKKKKSAPCMMEQIFIIIQLRTGSCPLASTPCPNRVSARIPPIASKDSLDETSSPSVAQSLRTGSCPLASTPYLLNTPLIARHAITKILALSTALSVLALILIEVAPSR